MIGVNAQETASQIKTESECVPCGGSVKSHEHMSYTLMNASDKILKIRAIHYRRFLFSSHKLCNKFFEAS